ncbi:MAG: hypothetical protein M1352_02955 [Patescibacteria group bacterium]|nr:hypothetical protein [Patescibacteria group bacterium]
MKKLLVALNKLSGSLSLPVLTVILTLTVAHYLSGGKLLGLFDAFHHHQEINSWKIYEIEKNHLNPFSYDLALPDLSGGRFVSFWDPPLSYVLALILSKCLFFLNDARFLAAVKLTSVVNLGLSIVSFYLLLICLGVRRLLASIFTFMTFTHGEFLIGLSYVSLNLPGLWALVVPILIFLKLKHHPGPGVFFIFGLSLALSFLQNPYYGFFVAAFLCLPVLQFIFSKKDRRKILAGLMVSLATIMVLMAITKGPDIYKIVKNHYTDPEFRDYSERQVRIYRPWYHFLAPGGHPLETLINGGPRNLMTWLSNKGIVDYLTLWPPDATNHSYLGILNLAAFLVLSSAFLFFYKQKKPDFKIYAAGYVFGALLCFRADLYLFSRHIIFPWYFLQKVLPFTSLHYFSGLAVLLFFAAFAWLTEAVVFRVIDKRSQKTKLVSFFLMILFLTVSFADTSFAVQGPSCTPVEDKALSVYLKDNPKERIFLQLPGRCDAEVADPRNLDGGLINQPLDWDARFYQIFYKAPIFAPQSLTWFDSYRYDPPLKNLRTLKSVLTDENKTALKSLGVQEIVLYLDYTDVQEYWNDFLKPRYRSAKAYRIFNQAIVFSNE